MIAALRMLAASLCVVLVMPVFGADPANFALWTSADLMRHDEALSKKVGPDHSARETLADYTSHRFRMLYRDGDGFPEQHDNLVDVVMVQSGESTLLLGGRMIGKRSPEGAGAGEFVGTGIEGGERHRIGAGDVLHIPPGVPHSFLVEKGKHVTYVLVKFPGQAAR